MKSLKLHNITFKYPSSPHSIFQDLSLEFHKGWTGIVGANGSGKTTLLQLITKNLTPEIGSISKDLIISFCPQSIEKIPFIAEEFFTTYNSQTFKTKDLLEISDDWFYRWEDLSGGEKKRVQLGCCFFQNPDVLIVDEPTNHLDLETKKKVFHLLKEFDGIGILVSHDRSLLDLLCHETLILKNSHFQKIRSNYTTAIKEIEKEKSFQQEKKEKQSNQLKKLDSFIQQNREKVAQSKKKLSKKNIHQKDKSTKEKINLAKLTGKDKNSSQLIKNTISKKKQILKEPIKVLKEYEKGILFENKPDKKTFPFTIEESKTTFNNLTVTIPKLTIDLKDKIWIKGENASGKTTILKKIISQISTDFIYIPQEIEEEESKRIFQEIKEMDNNKKGEIFTIITRLSSDPKALLESKNPSPGEIRKLILAKELLKKPSLIILDEPTNHMDIDSIISIEKALKEYQGALVFISHDLTFSQSLQNKIWYVTKRDNHISLE